MSNDVIVVDAPLLEEPDNVTEDERIVYIHMRLVVAALGQMLLYSLTPKSPPWVFCLLLSPSEAIRASALNTIRSMWTTVRLLERSSVAVHGQLLAKLPFLKWRVVREVFELLDVAGWVLDPAKEAAQIALQYVKALFAGLKTTIHLENGFNDLRDNEAHIWEL